MNDRTVMQQALEALERAVPTGEITLADWMKAATDLRAALAEPDVPECFGNMAVTAAVAAERERCAKLCEAQLDEPTSREWNMAVKCCAATLRAQRCR